MAIPVQESVFNNSLIVGTHERTLAMGCAGMLGLQATVSVEHQTFQDGQDFRKNDDNLKVTWRPVSADGADERHAVVKVMSLTRLAQKLTDDEERREVLEMREKFVTDYHANLSK